MMGVYSIQVGKKRYIGSALNLKSRLYSHRNSLFNNKSQVKEMQKDFNLIGCVKLEILAVIKKEKHLRDLENYFIGLYDSIDNGYNKALATNLCFGNEFRFNRDEDFISSYITEYYEKED